MDRPPAAGGGWPMSLSVHFDHQFTNLKLDIAFEAPTPGVTALFGPSGCGKSTIVMAVAGLLRPDRCNITLDGVVLADTGARAEVPVERRRIGMVFQDSRLFPHMSVLKNLHFGRRRSVGGTSPIRFDDVVELLGIGHLLGRRPNSLSGGERQRVAIGRALLAQPVLLAMDEPLASLDGPRKAEILPYLARLKTTLKMPILYVTHATQELASLADTLVLLNRGQVIAAGPFEEIVTRSDLPFATRDDSGAVLTGAVVAHDQRRQLTQLQSGSVSFWVSLLTQEVGYPLRIRIPAREVILAPAIPGPISVQNVITGRVRAITPDLTKHTALVEIALPDQKALLARVTLDAVDRLALAVGKDVVALIEAAAIEILPG
jgi:molybdate transport system ATP-binding protein